MRRISTALVILPMLLTAAPAAAQIKIGLAGPMTGANASFGEQLKTGAEAAVAAANANGGVLGKTVVLVVADDACDPRQAVSVANKFVAEGVMFINGHFCSGSTIPASEVYSDAGAVTVTVSTNPKVTDQGLKSIFRISGRDDQQGPILANYILTDFKGARAAVVHDKTPFGAGLAEQVAQRLKGGGQPIVFEAGINPGERDYNALITRLKSANVRVLFFGGYHTEAALILKQAEDQGLKIQMIGGDPLASIEFSSLAGALAEEVLFTFPPDPRNEPAAGPAVAAMRARNVEPEGWALYSYAVMQVLLEGIRNASTADPTAVAQTIARRSFSTVVGEVSFDPKGDNRRPGFVVYSWRGGKHEVAALR